MVGSRYAVGLLILVSCGPRLGHVNSPGGTAVGSPSGKEPMPTALTVPASSAPGITVSAAAPAGIDGNYLGVPLDSHFNPFQGAAGTTLFPGAVVQAAPMNQMDHGVVFSDDSIGFDANVRAYTFLSAGVGAVVSNRYAAYRARQIERIDTLDDRVAARAAPAGAMFYAWKIYYGHSFDAVLFGSSNAFHAGIRAKLTKTLSGGIEAFAKNESLDYRFVGLGMKPKNGEAIFAFSPDEITKAYDTTGPAVPIFVEYRSLPGSVVERKPLPWARSYRVQIAFQTLNVIKDGAAIFKPTWLMRASCDLNGKRQLVAQPTILPAGTKVSESDPAYPLSWSHTFEAVGPTDQPSCGVEGLYTNKLGTGPLPEARTHPIALNPAWVQTGEFEGANGAAKYRVTYTVTIVENAAP